MRAKNEYKFLEEAYTQVHTEDTSIEDLVGVDVVWGHPREEFRGVIKDIDVEKGSAWVRRDDGNEVAVDIEDFDHIGDRKFLGSAGHPDDLGPDRSEEQETHKPYVSSYMPFHRDEDDKLKPSKKIWAVLDKRGNAIFTSNNKDEAYEWFDDNFERLRDEGDEYDEESYWTPELTDEPKIKDHGPVRQRRLLTPKEEKKIDANQEKLHASKVKSSFGKKRWE